MLKEIIDKFYLDKQKNREQKHFYISDAGKCPRQIFFKFKNAPKKEMEARILRIFDHGDDIHKLIMKPLFGTRDVHVVASEIDIPSQEIISGSCSTISNLAEQYSIYRHTRQAEHSVGKVLAMFREPSGMRRR